MHCEKVVHHIVDWLRDYAANAEVDGYVVGVSGGIDSALTSTLCARTGLSVLLLELPIHQAESQVTRAQEHIKWLEDNYSNVRSRRVDLTDPFETLINAWPDIDNKERLSLTLANTRARLRMTALYHFAGLYGHLVAGTGNKVEDFGVGFFTKYGDGGVDVGPIADLLKTEVYELARHLGVADHILDAPPTDGLWGDDRTDEDQLGASYAELEWAMKFVAKGGHFAELEGRKKEVLNIYLRLNKANQHKMVPVPVCEIPEELK